MIEPPENLILHKLQEMRVEIAARDEKTQAQIGVLAQGLNSVRTELRGIHVELKDIRGEIRDIRNTIHELALAVDHHTSRLDRIEQHLGIDAAKH